jgi:hypothetical protein
MAGRFVGHQPCDQTAQRDHDVSIHSALRAMLIVEPEQLTVAAFTRWRGLVAVDSSIAMLRA